MPDKYLRDWKQIENKSNFVQLAMDQQVGIMQWAMMRERLKYPANPVPTEAQIADFNKVFPLDPLTKTRKKWQENLAKPRELW